MWIQSDDDFVGQGVNLDLIAALPQVQRVARGSILFMRTTTPAGRTLELGELTGIASADGRWGDTVDRWAVLDGRRSDPRRVDEIVLGFDEAERLGAHVGDTVDLAFPTTDRFVAAFVAGIERLPDVAAGHAENPFDANDALQEAVRLRAKVVGIVVMPGSVPPFAGSIAGAVQLTPAFFDRYAGGLASTGFLAVQLRPGAGLATFKTAVEGLEGDALFLTSKPTQTKAVDRSLALQANVLWIVGAVVLFVLLLLLAQALARSSASESGDFPTLRALGMTRRELFLVGLGRACVVAAPAAVLSAVTAMALSVFWPAGLAGTVEPSPGFSVDVAAIVIGAILVFVVVVLLAAWPAWRVADSAGRRHRAAARPSALAQGVGIGSLAFSARIGARLTLESGRAARGVPVRTAIAVGVAAIAATAMMVGFSSSLTHLRDTPNLYGWTWDAQVGARGLPDISGPLVAGLESNPAVADIAVGAISNVSINHARIDALALDAVRGRIEPRLLDGRAPRADDEIVLGSTTMRDLDIEIGDDVEVAVGDQSTAVRVVGTRRVPEFRRRRATRSRCRDAVARPRGARCVGDEEHRARPVHARPPARAGPLDPRPRADAVPGARPRAARRPRQPRQRPGTGGGARPHARGARRSDPRSHAGRRGPPACHRPRGAEGARSNPAPGRCGGRLAGDRPRPRRHGDRDPTRRRGRPGRLERAHRRTGGSLRTHAERRRARPHRTGVLPPALIAASGPALSAARTRPARALRNQ